MISPEAMKAAVPSSTIKFYTILAPKAEDADPEVVTNKLYSQVIEQLVSTVDLLIIDTQTSELVDIPAIMSQVMTPILANYPNAYALGIPDSSSAAISNTKRIAKSIINGGVKNDHIFFLFNRMAIGADLMQLQREMSGLGSVVAAIRADQNVTTRPSLANGIDLKTPYAQGLMDVLHRVTGRPEFVTSDQPLTKVNNGSKILSFFKKG